MKNTIVFLMLNMYTIAMYACPVCERNQPKLLRGIVHGKGPDSNWDYISVWITVIISVVALFYTVKWLIKPGEKDENHIKYSIIEK